MADISVPKYFEGKSVLVTGATGSVGKALVAKLLRSCPGIKTIYLIVRPKKGEMVQDRWNKTLESKLYEKLRNERPEVFSKVVVMQGDNVLDNYGLSPEDMKILEENVNIIYHGAATINFAEELRNAVLTNMKSTYTLCEMGKNMKNLECFVHVSTAYCNAHLNKGKTQEVISPAIMDWRALIAMSDNPVYSYALSVLEPKLMSGHWTTYTLTKAMAENIVDDYSQFFLSTAIMRVSLVIGAQFEPEPGWTDSINFLAAICVGVRSGVIRVCLTEDDQMAPQIYLDTCIRSLILAPWYLHRQNIQRQAEIFCCRVSYDKTYSYGDVRKMGNVIARITPWQFSLYYPFIVFTTSPLMYKCLFIFMHVFPGLMLDKLLEFTGKKPMLMKIYRRYWKLVPTMKSSLGTKLDFSRENYLQLDKNLLDEEKADFTLDESNFYDKEEFFGLSSICIFKHMSNGKEKLDEESMARSRKRLAWQRIAHIVLVVSLGVLLASLTSFIYKRSSVMLSLGPTVLPVLYCVYAIFTVAALKTTVAA